MFAYLFSHIHFHWILKLKGPFVNSGMRHRHAASASACGIGMRHWYLISWFQSQRKVTNLLWTYSQNSNCSNHSESKYNSQQNNINLLFCWVLAGFTNRYHFIETMLLFKLDLCIRRVYLHYIVLELCNCSVNQLKFFASEKLSM